MVTDVAEDAEKKARLEATLPYFGLLAAGASLADGSSLADGVALADGAALADGSIDDVVTARSARSLAAVNNVV